MTNDYLLKVKKLKDEDFKTFTGVNRKTFNTMVQVVEEAEIKLHKEKKGRYSNMSIEQKVLMTLEYWKEYPSMLNLGIKYGIVR